MNNLIAKGKQHGIGEDTGAGMKKEWEIRNLGQVCEVVNGGTPKTGVSEYWDGKNCWITPAEMGKRLSPFVHETERKITDLGLRNSSAQMLPPNSVILSSRAPIGHLVINTTPMATNQGCKGLIPGSQVQHKFLYYYLSGIIDLLNSLGTGATFKELSAGKLKEVTIPVPPLPEQRRIVGILDEAFAGIAKAKTNAEKNLQNARALFESHLNAIFSKRGEGWVEKPLGECLRIRNGESLPSQKMVENGNYPVYGGNGINGRYDRPNLTGENIVIGRVGAKCGNVHLIRQDAWVTDNALYISNYSYSFHLDFLTRLLRFKDLRNRAREMAQPVISYTTIKDVILEFPPEKAKQRKIADEILGIENETHCLESIYQSKLVALEALKKSLLHQAFSGEL